jgi:hydrogenase maturation protease
MCERRRETLVIGVGNRFRGDDGVGLMVARRLEARGLAGVDVVEHTGDGVGLIALWQAARRVFVLDAMSSGGPPGRTCRFDVRAVGQPRGLLGCSSHGLGVVEAIALARQLGRLPPELVVYGIEGGSFAPGLSLSPALASAAVALEERVVRDVLSGRGHCC